MENVSLLEVNGKLSFTYSMRYTEEFIPGNYNCYMHYNTNDCVGHFKIPLQQENGRIWVGYYRNTCKQYIDY